MGRISCDDQEVLLRLVRQATRGYIRASSIPQYMSFLFHHFDLLKHSIIESSEYTVATTPAFNHSKALHCHSACFSSLQAWSVTLTTARTVAASKRLAPRSRPIFAIPMIICHLTYTYPVATKAKARQRWHLIASVRDISVPMIRCFTDSPVLNHDFRRPAQLE